MWPVHLKPQKDELLSSWLIRLAHAHGYKVESFCTLLFGRGSAIWNRDIDIMAPDFVKEAIIDVTGSTFAQFEKTTLKSLDGYLNENTNLNGMNRWVLPVGIHNRKRKRHGLLFCPTCLSEDISPYYRKQWRLAYSVVCVKHGNTLFDACPKCGSVIAPHRTDMGSGNIVPDCDCIVQCWNCGFNLRKSNPVIANARLINFQTVMDETLSAGWVTLSDGTTLNSILFFKGLRELITGLSTKESRKRIKSNERDETGKSMVIEYCSLSARVDMMKTCAHILEVWPGRFIHLIHDKRLRYSDLKSGNRNLAYWYEKIIKIESQSGNPPLSNSEKQSIVDYVEYNQGYYTNQYATDISGHDISDFIGGYHQRKVDDNIYAELLVGIDHKIAVTFDKQQRNDLIRDKIMFAYARIFNLTLQKISDMNISDILDCDEENTDFDFVNIAMSKKAVTSWCRWYIKNIRSQILAGRSNDALFISSQTRNRLKKSIISKRFNRVVKLSGAERYIHGYKCLIS